MPTPLTVVAPEGWPRPKGYSNGLVGQGPLLFVAGQVGWNPSTGEFPKSFDAQFAQALANVHAVLKAGGASPSQVARLTIYVTDKREYLGALKAVGQAFRDVFQGHYPVMALVQVAALVEDHAKVEIEATAALG